MPLSPLPNTGVILPTPDGDSGIWDDELNAALRNFDNHTHEAGKGLRVPTAGIKINADLSFALAGVFFAIKDLKSVDFEPRPASEMTSYAAALFFNSSDSNELYVKKQDGTLIKMTAGASINASVIGGIGGDYASVGALVDFVDASDTYRMRQQTGASVRQFARVQQSDLDLYEYLAHPATPVPTNRVRLKSPAALAGSYDLTLLTALPGSTQILQVSSTGAITASNTVANAAVFSSTVGINGTLTLGANVNLVQSGTGDHQHGSRTITCDAHVGVVGTGAGTWALDAGTTAPSSANAGAEWWYPVHGLRTGDRVTRVDFYGNGQVTGNVTSTIRRRSLNAGAGGTAVATITSSVPAVAPNDYVQSVTGLTSMVTDTDSFYVSVIVPGGGVHKVFGCKITYDHP